MKRKGIEFKRAPHLTYRHFNVETDVRQCKGYGADYFERDPHGSYVVIVPVKRCLDADGDLDLALANNNAAGVHQLYRNLLTAEDARRSIQVMVLDSTGTHTLPGAEVRVYEAGTALMLSSLMLMMVGSTIAIKTTEAASTLKPLPPISRTAGTSNTSPTSP